MTTYLLLITPNACVLAEKKNGAVVRQETFRASNAKHLAQEALRRCKQAGIQVEAHGL